MFDQLLSPKGIIEQFVLSIGLQVMNVGGYDGDDDNGAGDDVMVVMVLSIGLQVMNVGGYDAIA